MQKSLKLLAIADTRLSQNMMIIESSNSDKRNPIINMQFAASASERQNWKALNQTFDGEEAV